MFEIVDNFQLAPEIFQVRIFAPDICRAAKPGQFVILRVDEGGERIPLTIFEADREKGILSLIVQIVGRTTQKLSAVGKGEAISDVSGPLGHPTEIDKYGQVACVAGGLGAAIIYPVAKALKEAGNKIITILGARNEDLLILERELEVVSEKLIVTTDDGSKGRHGVVTEPLEELLKEGVSTDRVWAIGPAIMMKFVCKTTEPYGVKTIVSLNPIMVDGTGMCGSCRVEVGGKTRFGCVDGPEFDGHDVDFDLLMARQRQYLDEEKKSIEYALEREKEDVSQYR